MKKTLMICLGVLMILACISMVACSKADSAPNETKGYSLNFNTVYALAEEAGYTGTLEDLIALFKGKDAYELAKASGYAGTEQQWLDSLVGAAGKDGATPIIGANKHWFINDIDTGILAEGKDGINGATPTIGENKNWFIDGIDTGVCAAGQSGTDGFTPTIGDNKHWFINNADLELLQKVRMGQVL